MSPIPVAAMIDAAKQSIDSMKESNKDNAAAGQGSLAAPPNLNGGLQLNPAQQAQLKQDTQQSQAAGGQQEEEKNEEQPAPVKKQAMVKDWRKTGKTKGWREYAYDDGTEGKEKEDKDKDGGEKEETAAPAKETTGNVISAEAQDNPAAAPAAPVTTAPATPATPAAAPVQSAVIANAANPQMAQAAQGSLAAPLAPNTNPNPQINTAQWLGKFGGSVYDNGSPQRTKNDYTE